ncbi:DUF6702 family protein [Flavicella sp.]|uniref:DUF6702 family protein n=1 Tax=Flavicella sp. TaxID=2957742 RepID=UPI0030171B92
MRLFLLVLFTSFSTYAHDYFFAFAEVEYNETSKKLETTLIVSTHDLESAIKEEGIIIVDFSEIENDSKDFEILENYLLRHFKIKSTKSVNFKLLGFKISLKGVTEFYLESESVTIENQVDVFYDLLMNHNKKQQNKITFYYKQKSYTKPFLISVKTQTIKFN